MSRAPVGLPSPAQQRLLDAWLPGAEVVHDHSWGLTERAVLEVTRAGQRYIVKAGGPRDHHMDREIHAHRTWLDPWTSRGRAPRVVHADVEARLLVTVHLPGRLLLDSEHVDDWRPAMTDFSRLHVQQLRGRPGLEQAFLDGYGADPREPEAWHRTLVREAVSTAAWAHQVGDEEFEAQGLRMVDDALATVPG